MPLYVYMLPLRVHGYLLARFMTEAGKERVSSSTYVMNEFAGPCVIDLYLRFHIYRANLFRFDLDQFLLLGGASAP